MLRLEWSPRALDQLDMIIGYIAERKVYRVADQTVRILSVLHTRQQYPRINP